MEKTKVKTTVVWMLLGLGINYIGKTMALKLQLPVWLDCIGTGITAGLLGPFYGALCGFTSNIIYGLKDITQIVFAVTNIVIGLIVGVYVKKGKLNKFIDVLNLSAILMVISVIISTPFECILWHGFTGNVWGTAVVEMIRNNAGWSTVTCSIVGQCFIEIPDKFIMVLMVYFALKIKNNTELKRTGKTVLSMIIFCFMFLAALPVNVSAAQNSDKDTIYSSEYSFRVFSSDEGLTSGEANDIAQTTDGYIWVGTYAGLYSYDGVHFELKKDLENVKNVNCLYVDEPGRLWIGTNDSGVVLMVRGKVSSSLSVKDGLPANSVRCITSDSNGNIYIGTSKEMCICTIDNGLKIIKTIDEIQYASSVSVDASGRAVVINNDGDLFILENMEITKEYQHKDSGYYYTTGSFLRDGRYVAINSINEVFYWSFENGIQIEKSNVKITDMHKPNSVKEDDQRDGYLWICCDNGIGYIDEKGIFYIVNTGDFNSSIDKGMTDYQGNIWFTSSRLGVLELTKNTFTNLYQQTKLNAAVVNSAVVWNGILYSGTDSGLDLINLADKSIVENKLSKMLKGERIRCLKVDSNNHLWICVTDGNGLYEVLPNGTMHIYNVDCGTVDNRFRSIIELSDHTMAAAENTGITFIKEGCVTGTLSAADGLSCTQILSMIEDKDGSVLAGSDGGGIYVIKEQKIIKQITQEDGLSSDVILRIAACKDGYLIVTANGLCYWKEDGQIKILDQFPYFNNYDAFCTKDGKVWILSSAGFYVIKEDDLLANSDANYLQLDRKSGFMSNLTANSWSYVDEKGNAYFCCSNGLYGINIYNFNMSKSSYRIKVDSIIINDVVYSAELNSTIKISGDIQRMEIKPIVFNYTLNNPSIKYYLEGFENRENVVKQSDMNSIVYTNIPSGTYTFHIELLDSMQENVLEYCTYTIVKEKEFWENWWFQLYFILDGIFLVMFITYLITKNYSNSIIEKQRKEIEFARKQAEMGNETILAIAKTVDAKDDNTSQHSERVAQYSVLIAQRLGWDEKQIEGIRKIALLHDIGKVGIPDSVLKKPASLTNEEYAVMKSHVTIGAEILKDFSLVENVADGAKYHHERYDGKGYELGLKGEQIPLIARIICVADSFDAMTSNRVYRKRMDMDYVLSELKNGKGKQFDPKIVDIFLTLLEDGSIDVTRQDKKENKTKEQSREVSHE